MAERPLFPYEPLELGKVAILFDRFKDDERPLTEHRALPLPSPGSERVAILVDGIGSSSAGLYVAHIREWLDVEGFAT